MKPSLFVRLALIPGALLMSGAALAAPPSTSPYSTDPQNSHVEDATSEGVGQVNMIACIMAAMRPEMFVNKGAYNALVNEAKCEPSGSTDSAASGDAGQAPKYMTAIVNATRASNSDPMISKIWIVQEEEGHQTHIDVHVSATAAPTASNPYGSFTLFFCGHEPNSTLCRMNGFLEGSDNGIRYFQTETRDDGNGLETSNTALKLSASGTTSGSGRMQMDHGNQSMVFNFAYNSGLYLRDDGTDTQCFSRDASDPETGMSVWRYALYDSTSGERVTRNSGFPIDFTSGGETWHGYLGYSGLSLPAAAMNVLQSGDTVQKVDYSAQAATKTNYTVVKSGGRLLKFTRQQRTLAGMDRIRFTTFVNNVSGFIPGAVANTQYEMYWDDTAKVFKVTGQMNCSMNGCQTQALQSEQSVSPAFWQNQPGVQGWSQSLGGELFIKLQGAVTVPSSQDVTVSYRTQDLVYPADLPATLFCVRDCPSSASIAAFFAQGSQANTPYAGASANNFNPTALANVQTYHTNTATALLLDANSQPVTITDPEAAQRRPQYQYGLRTGRLVADLEAAKCAPDSNQYCDWKINDQEVYYQWETGPSSFNQFAAVKDSSGHFVAFDAPLQVTFQVPNGVKYGEYAGQSLVLQYSGYGDLWGVPGHCVSRFTNETLAECGGEDARYVPAFVIPHDAIVGRVTQGSNTYLVKWLDREIRFAKKTPAACSAAQLVAPTGVVLPTSSVLKSPSDPNADVYVGVKPVVNTAPRVIHGEIKY